MNLFRNAADMYNAQGEFGRAVCNIIIVFFILFIVIEWLRGLWLSGLKRGLAGIRSNSVGSNTDSDSEGKSPVKPGQPRHGYLKSVYEQFVAVKERNANAADLDAIMDKEIPTALRIGKNLAALLPGLMISLGLLGTFYGLANSIGSLMEKFDQQAIMSNTQQDLEAFAEFINVIRSPLASMSTAFTTSLFGLLLSILASLFNTMVFAHKEEKVFAHVIDYFENEIGSAFESGLDRAVIKLKDGLQESIDRFSGHVKDLSITMESSVTTINNSMLGLNQAIGGMQAPIDNFRACIEVFNRSCSTLDEQVEAVNQITARLGREMGETLQSGLQVFVMRMEQVTAQFSDRLDKASSNLSESMITAVERLHGLIDTINDNLASTTASNREMKLVLSTLNSTYDNYLSSVTSINQLMDNNTRMLHDLDSNIRTLSITVSDQMRAAFDDAVITTANESASLMASQLRQETEQMNKVVAFTNETLSDLREKLLGAIRHLQQQLESLVDEMRSGNAAASEHIISSLQAVTDSVAASYEDFHTNVLDLNGTADLLKQALKHLSDIQMQMVK
jgi:ABC-type transporter Mla subunit MlaD